jgi:phage-related protein
MPSVIDSITTFITSIFNAVFSVFSGALGLVQDFLNVIVLAFSTFFSAIGTSIKELAVTFEGLTKFLISM